MVAYYDKILKYFFNYFFFIKMVYARRYRRKNTRRNRTLSTRRIFNNKSAKSQAKQIYALKQRVRRVYNQCKPEVKMHEPLAYYNRAFQHPGVNLGGVQWLFTDIPTPGSGYLDNQRIGSKISLKPLNLFITTQYQEFMNSLKSGWSTTNIPLNSSAIQLRLVVIQSLQASPDLLNQNTVNLRQIFEYSALDEAPTDPISWDYMMRVPFKTGITSTYKILMDRHITVSKDSPYHSKRLSIKPYIKSRL